MRVKTACILFTLGLGGCAHGPAGDVAQASYDLCPGTSLTAAEANLGKAGYKLAPAPATPGTLETGWNEFETRQGDATGTSSLRVKVQGAEGGVRFSIWAADGAGEVRWDTLTPEQVKDDVARALLNRIRKDVCGAGSSPEFLTAG